MRQWQRMLAASAACLAFLLTAAAAQAEQRIALVVGMSKYQNVPQLKNPRNDARLMADTLKALGFTLVNGDAQFDLDKPGFDSAVRAFGRAIQGADVALFYYAGHGVQVDGANWLVPITADPQSPQDLDYETVDAQLIIKQMDRSGAKLKLVILDACRNNPFGGRGIRATTGGLAQMQAPRGTLISYATQPGNIALDGDDGNSPYTRALARQMRQPGLDVLRLFNAVGNDVVQATGGRQQPWLSSSPIEGDFFFAGATGRPSANEPRNPAQPQQALRQRDKACTWSTREEFIGIVHSASWSGSGGDGGVDFGGPANGNYYAFYHVELTDLRLRIRPSAANEFSANLEALATETTTDRIGVIPPNTHRFLMKQFQAGSDSIRIDFDGAGQNAPRTAATFVGRLNEQCQLQGQVVVRRIDLGPPFNWVVTVPVTLSKGN